MKAHRAGGRMSGAWRGEPQAARSLYAYLARLTLRGHLRRYLSRFGWHL